MKKIFILLTSIIISGCGGYSSPRESLMSADINGVTHRSQFTEYPTTLEPTANGHYYLCSDSRVITSDDGHEAQICLKFNDDVDIIEFKPFTRYTIKAYLRYDIEPEIYKTYETSDGWIEFTYIKEYQREVFRLEGKFEFDVKDPDSGQILVSVTNGRFDLPVS